MLLAERIIPTGIMARYQQYLALYDASRDARYEAYSFRNKPEEVATLVNNSMSIEEHINTLLAMH